MTRKVYFKAQKTYRAFTAELFEIWRGPSGHRLPLIRPPAGQARKICKPTRGNY